MRHSACDASTLPPLQKPPSTKLAPISAASCRQISSRTGPNSSRNNGDDMSTLFGSRSFRSSTMGEQIYKSVGSFVDTWRHFFRDDILAAQPRLLRLIPILSPQLNESQQ